MRIQTLFWVRGRGLRQLGVWDLEWGGLERASQSERCQDGVFNGAEEAFGVASEVEAAEKGSSCGVEV